MKRDFFTIPLDLDKELILANLAREREIERGGGSVIYLNNEIMAAIVAMKAAAIAIRQFRCASAAETLAAAADASAAAISRSLSRCSFSLSALALSASFLPTHSMACCRFWECILSVSKAARILSTWCFFSSSANSSSEYEPQPAQIGVSTYFFQFVLKPSLVLAILDPNFN